MRLLYLGSFALAFFLSFVATVIVLRLSEKKRILDFPDDERKFHARPTPTMGGLAIYGSFLAVVLVIGLLFGFLLHGNIPLRLLIGILLGGAVLMIGGVLDDRYRLRPLQSIWFPVLACLILVASGISAVSVHNPFTGSIIMLDQIKLWGLPVLSGLIVFIWTMTMTYTTKLLDGMDGLVTGVSAIGALVLFGLSLSSPVQQPQTALLAIIFTGSLLGFLILNFYPAEIFLGDGGSTFTGFMLAVLAIVSGGKIATALLVMGLPLLDMVWVVIQRLLKKQSPFSGDRKHLHFKLLDIGLTQSQTVLFLYAVTGIFGGLALLLQSRGKLIALLALIVVMLAIIAVVYSLYKRRNNSDE